MYDDIPSVHTTVQYYPVSVCVVFIHRQTHAHIDAFSVYIQYTNALVDSLTHSLLTPFLTSRMSHRSLAHWLLLSFNVHFFGSALLFPKEME